MGDMGNIVINLLVAFTISILGGLFIAELFKIFFPDNPLVPNLIGLLGAVGLLILGLLLFGKGEDKSSK